MSKFEVVGTTTTVPKNFVLAESDAWVYVVPADVYAMIPEPVTDLEKALQQSILYHSADMVIEKSTRRVVKARRF